MSKEVPVETGRQLTSAEFEIEKRAVGQITYLIS